MLPVSAQSTLHSAFSPAVSALFLTALAANRLAAHSRRFYSSSSSSSSRDGGGDHLGRLVLSQTDFYDMPSESEIRELECECGLQRDEYLRARGAGGPPPSEELVRSFAPYERHLFVYSGQRAVDWRPTQEKEGFALLLQSEIKQQMKQRQKYEADRGLQARTGKVKVGLLEWPSESQLHPEKATSGFDVLVMPDGVLYRSLQEDMIPQFVETQIVRGDVFDGTRSERTDGVHHVFVCSHLKRDARCGHMGPRIYKAFVEKAKQRGLTNVHVHRTSHVGGHKYAGNVIVFRHSDTTTTTSSSGGGGHPYTGDWYGYVNDTTDVDTLLDEHIVGGRIVTDLWRGRCALPPGVTALDFLKQQQQQQQQ